MSINRFLKEEKEVIKTIDFISWPAIVIFCIAIVAVVSVGAVWAPNGEEPRLDFWWLLLCSGMGLTVLWGTKTLFIRRGEILADLRKLSALLWGAAEEIFQDECSAGLGTSVREKEIENKKKMPFRPKPIPRR